MSTFRLSDSNLSSNIRGLFLFRIGQRVCALHQDGRPDLGKVGEVIDGELKAANAGQGGSREDHYQVRLENGEVIVLRFSHITDAPEMVSHL